MNMNYEYEIVIFDAQLHEANCGHCNIANLN